MYDLSCSFVEFGKSTSMEFESIALAVRGSTVEKRLSKLRRRLPPFRSCVCCVVSSSPVITYVSSTSPIKEVNFENCYGAKESSLSDMLILTLPNATKER